MPVSRYVPKKFEPWPLAQDPPREPKPNLPASGLELFAFAVLAGTTALGFALAFIDLAPLDPTQSVRPPGNRIHQGPNFILLDVFLLLVFIYTAKRVILRRVARSREVMWYLLVLLTSHAFMWYLVPDWYHPHDYSLLCWIGYPMLIWTIPTVTFVRDRLNPEPPSTGCYLVRSAYEVAFIFPYWCLFCGTLFETLRVNWIR
jgi:hypothetical protein